MLTTTMNYASAVSAVIQDRVIRAWGAMPTCGGVAQLICGAPQKDAREMVRECERELRKQVREQERAIYQYKLHNDRLKAKIVAMKKAGKTNKNRDMLAAAHEMLFIRRDMARSYEFGAHLKSLGNEIASQRSQMGRDQLIADTAGIIRIFGAMNPPAECFANMKEFAKQMEKAGLANEEASAIFDRTLDPTDDDVETENAKLEILINDVVASTAKKSVDVVSPALPLDDEVDSLYADSMPQPQSMNARSDGNRFQQRIAELLLAK